MSYWAVIPAAGIGSRMQSKIPKQYLKINDQTVLDLTLEIFLSHKDIAGVVVALSKGAKEDSWWSKSRYFNHEKIQTVEGGAERYASVLNALDALSKHAEKNDWVLVHDAARPCLRADDIDLLIEKGSVHEIGALLGVPVKDTMKRTDSHSVVSSTVDREQLWHAYTPQMFRLGQLEKTLVKAIDAEVQVTDEASAMEWAGLPPLMVKGRSDNIKITEPDDLALAEFYLKI